MVMKIPRIYQTKRVVSNKINLLSIKNLNFINSSSQNPHFHLVYCTKASSP